MAGTAPARVHLSFGVPKSASSFVFQLTLGVARRAAAERGVPLLTLADLFPECGPSTPGSAQFTGAACALLGLPRGAQGLTDLMDRAIALLADRPGILVAKTHDGCQARLAERVDRGEVGASATLRHPADALLSLADMRRREDRVLDPAEHATLLGLWEESFGSWQQVPGVPIFPFDLTASAPHRVVDTLAAQFDLQVPVHDVVDRLLADRTRIWMYNKGVPDRRVTEMSADEVAAIEARAPLQMAALAWGPRGVVAPAPSRVTGAPEATAGQVVAAEGALVPTTLGPRTVEPSTEVLSAVAARSVESSTVAPSTPAVRTTSPDCAGPAAAVTVDPRQGPPVVAVVTPALDCVDYIDQAVRSIVGQHGDFTLRYHVQDGGSTDGTLERLAAWSRVLADGGSALGLSGVDFSFASSPDPGIYAALNRGFAHVQGDLLTWLASDDLLFPGAIQSVVTLVRDHPDVRWVMGRPMVLGADTVPRHQSGPMAGAAGWDRHTQAGVAAGRADGTGEPIIQQEGSFWTASLWRDCGAHLREDLGLAGDFELWTRMARHAVPVRVPYPLAAHRRRQGQLSADLEAYSREVAAIRAGLPEPPPGLCQEAIVATPPGGPDSGWVVAAVPSGPSPLPVRPSPVPARPARPSPAPRMRRREGGPTPTGPATPGAADTAPRPPARPPSPAAQPAQPRPSSWQFVGHARHPEGPFPDLGIEEPFFWLTGPASLLRFHVPGEGHYLVSMTLANPHRGQRIHLHAPGACRTVRPPAGAGVSRPFPLRAVVAAQADTFDLELGFRVARPGPSDDRALAAMLLDVSVSATEPTPQGPRWGWRRGR